MSDIKISVIIPVYNVEPYLTRCLDSLVNQTFKDIEIICVNDGSTDKSLDILRDYEKRDSRIKVIDKKNEGCSVARNSGLEVSSGEYIMYVDGDDYVDLSICEKLYNKITETNSDMVISTMHFGFKDEGGLKLYRPECMINSEESFYFNDSPEGFYDIFHCVWAKLFRKTDLKFHDELKRSGDAVYFWEYCIKYNPKISIINEPLYYYYQNMESIVHVGSTINKAKLFIAIEAFTQSEIFKNSPETVQVNILDRFMKSIISEIKYFKRVPVAYYRKCKKLLKLVEKYDRTLRRRMLYESKLREVLDNTLIARIFAFFRMIFMITNVRDRKVVRIFGIKIILKSSKEQSKKERKFIAQYNKETVNYPKDTYLLLDCTTDPTVESIDAYCLFCYMRSRGIKAYYIVMSESDLYKKLQAENNLENIIVIDNTTQMYPGDFLEKIYDVLLRTKAILSSFAPFTRTTEKFFRESKHLKYVFLQHGQLYIPERTIENNYINATRFNYMLVSSENEKNLLTSYGWDENTLLKAGLPRWDLLTDTKQNTEKSILVMFTWRRLKPNDFNESMYKNNILSLINNKDFIDYLKQNNIKIYYAPHHALQTLRGIDMPINNDYIEQISTQNISEYIRKCSCLITDFTSVSFDFMFQDKPVIFYLADAGDKHLNPMERKAVDNFSAHNKLPNIYYDQFQVIKKVKYYVENDFTVEPEAKAMCDKYFYTKENIREKLTCEIEKICG